MKSAFVIVFCLAFALSSYSGNERPANLMQWESVPPCRILKVTDGSGRCFEILKCPKTGEWFEKDKWIRYDVSKLNKAALTGFMMDSIQVPSITGYVSVEVKQGKTVFGYPFVDASANSNFLAAPLMQNAVDGDFVSYVTGGENVCLWATYAAKDNLLHWHSNETFMVVETAPYPDTYGNFLYYRMQNKTNASPILGVVAAPAVTSYSFHELGIEEAAKRAAQSYEERRSQWADSLINGACEWTREFKPTSIRDPRKFYVRLSSGERAFAMIHGDRKKLFSPITHSALTVENTEIEGFEPIADGAYKEEDCYSKNEVAEIWDDFSSDRGWFDMALEKLCGEHYIYGKPIKSLWGAFKYWIVFIYAPGVWWKRTRPTFLKPLLILLRLLKCVWRRKR